MYSRGVRDRLLGSITRALEHHPKVVVALVCLTFLAAIGVLASGALGVNSSRHGIVNASDPEQVRLRTFEQRFGAANDLIVVLSGAPIEALRASADAAADELRASELTSEVFYRLDTDALGDYALHYLPMAQLDRIGDAASLLDALTPAKKDSKTITLQGITPLLVKMTDGIEQLAEGQTSGLSGEISRGKVKSAAIIAAGVLGELEAWITQPQRDRLTLEERPAGDSKTGLGPDDQGYIVGAGGKLLVMRVTSTADMQDDKHARPLVDAVRAILEKHVAGGVDIGITGIPAMVVEEQDAIKRDLPLTSVISLVGCLTLFLLAYRSLRATLVVMVPLAVGLVWALALTALVVGSLNLLTNALAVILVGMGIDFTVHLMTRVRHERNLGFEPNEAVERAMVGTGPAILTGALTSAVAFLAMLFTDFRALEELGLIAGIGLMSVLLATFVTLPIMLGRAGSRFKLGIRETRLSARFTFPKRAAPALFAVSLLLTGYFALQIEPIRFYFDLDVLLPSDAESKKTLYQLRDSGIGGVEFAVMQPRSLDEVAAITAKLDALTGPGGVVDRYESINDVLPHDLERRNAAARDVHSALAKAPDMVFQAADAVHATAFRKALSNLVDALESDLPYALEVLGKKDLTLELPVIVAAARKLLAAARAAPDDDLAARVAAFEGRAENLTSHLDRVRTQPAKDLAPEVLPSDLTSPFYRVVNGETYFAVRVYPTGNTADPEFVRTFRDALRDIDPETTGTAITFVHFGVLMERGFRVAATWAAIIVLFLVLVDFRSPGLTILALVPLVVGGVWMVGLMNVLGIGYSFANVVAIPLIIGIGVDSGIHVIHRWRECDGDVDEALRSTGLAVLVSSLTTIMAFGALLFSSHGGTSGLGLTLLIGVSTCCIASLIVLPALLVTLQRIFPGRFANPGNPA